jgi:teichuronic acid biosynthesis protein TuaE
MIKEKSVFMISFNKIMLSLFYIMVCSSFFGAYLSLPSYKNIFLFRSTLYILIILFVIFFIKNRKFRIQKNIKNYQFFLIAWLTFSCFSVAWSIDLNANLKYNYFLTKNVILILMCIYFLNNFKRIEKMSKFLLLVLFINIIVALVEISTTFHFKILNSYYLNTWVERAPYTFFDNINDTAGYFTLFMPLSFIILSNTRKKRLLFTIIFTLTSFIVISTSSRVNYIVIILQLIYFIKLFLKIEKINTAKYIPKIFVSVLILVIVSVFIVIARGEYNVIESSLAKELISLKGVLSDKSGSLYIRRQLVIESINILIDSALIGVGAGNIEKHVFNAGISSLEGTYNLHNWWLELAGNYGIILFMGFIIFYLSILHSLQKIKYDEVYKSYNVYAYSSYISILSFSIVSLGSSSIIQIRYVWILLGIALAIINCYKSEIHRNEG